jgi:hypothetical protein
MRDVPGIGDESFLRAENVDLLLYPKISSEAVVLAEKGFVVISVSGALSGLRSGRKL